MGFGPIPTQPEATKTIICEREVKSLYFTIISKTIPRMSREEIDIIAQKIYDEISEINKNSIEVMSRKSIVENKEVHWEIDKTGGITGKLGKSWILRINNNPLFELVR